MRMPKFVIKVFMFGIFIAMFLYLETGFLVENIGSFGKPFIFALGLSFAFTRYRKFILLSSILLFLGMILFYIFWQLSISTLLGSTGFGLLIIYMIGLLPSLFKKGYVESL